MTDRSCWYSLEIALHHIAAQDQFLTGQIGPLIEHLHENGAVSRWFFLRHSEGGPHLRLRLYGCSQGWETGWGQTVRTRLADGLKQVAAAAPLDRAAYQVHSAAGSPDPFSQWYEDRTLHAGTYVPEYDRYGGPQGLALAERLFQASSELALSLLRQWEGQRGRLILLAAVLTLEATIQFNCPRTGRRDFFQRYAQHWERDGGIVLPESTRALASALRPLVAGLERGEAPLGAPQLCWRQTVATLRNELLELLRNGQLRTPTFGYSFPDAALPDDHRTLLALASSYIHLMNNRLGVLSRHESVLARALAAHLAE